MFSKKQNKKKKQFKFFSIKRKVKNKKKNNFFFLGKNRKRKEKKKIVHFPLFFFSNSKMGFYYSSEDCCVCLNKLNFFQVQILPCKHIVDANCLSKWTMGTCPLCRGSIEFSSTYEQYLVEIWKAINDDDFKEMCSKLECLIKFVPSEPTSIFFIKSRILGILKVAQIQFLMRVILTKTIHSINSVGPDGLYQLKDIFLLFNANEILNQKRCIGK